MWDLGGTGRKSKGPCTKQCAWRKHGSCDTRLAEAYPPKLWNTVKYTVEELRPKWPFWRHRLLGTSSPLTLKPPKVLAQFVLKNKTTSFLLVRPPRAPHCRSSRQASFLSDPHCPCLLIVSHLPFCKCASVAFWLGLPCGQPKCGTLSRKPLQCNSECRWLDVSTGGIWDAAATQNPHTKTQRTPRRHRSHTEFPPQFSENPPGQVTTESPTPILREPPPGEVTILALTSRH